MTTTASGHRPRRAALAGGYATWIPSKRRRTQPPDDRQVEILATLIQHGPLTTREVTELVGPGPAVERACVTLMCRGQVACLTGSDGLTNARWRAIEEGEL